MDKALTKEQIEELRPDDDAPMVADVRSDHMRTLCDMALRSLQPDGDTVRVPVAGHTATRWQIDADGNMVTLFFDTVTHMENFLSTLLAASPKDLHD